MGEYPPGEATSARQGGERCQVNRLQGPKPRGTNRPHFTGDPGGWTCHVSSPQHPGDILQRQSLCQNAEGKRFGEEALVKYGGLTVERLREKPWGSGGSAIRWLRWEPCHTDGTVNHVTYYRSHPGFPGLFRVPAFFDRESGGLSREGGPPRPCSRNSYAMPGEWPEVHTRDARAGQRPPLSHKVVANRAAGRQP
jgi:hypothetical protein